MLFSTPLGVFLEVAACILDLAECNPDSYLDHLPGNAKSLCTLSWQLSPPDFMPLVKKGLLISYCKDNIEEFYILFTQAHYFFWHFCYISFFFLSLWTVFSELCKSIVLIMPLNSLIRQCLFPKTWIFSYVSLSSL